MKKLRSDFDLERAKLSPADAFGTPADVLVAPINDDDKLEILNQWETDAKALARAGDEGMANGEPSLLHDVEVAREKLRETSSLAAARKSSP